MVASSTALIMQSIADAQFLRAAEAHSKAFAVILTHVKTSVTMVRTNNARLVIIRLHTNQYVCICRGACKTP